MNCLRCGRDLETDSTFCRHCGAPLRMGAAAPRRLVRRSAQGRLAGVCAGLADYLDVDVTLVRLVWIVLTIVPGGVIGGIITYIGAWVIMSDADAPPVAAPTVKRLTRSVNDRKIAGVCGGLAEYLSVDATAVRVAWAVLAIVPGAIVLGVLAYLVAWFIMPEGTASAAAAASPSAA
jgi:phage shock protein PspC (stress-responsive transcriptional regulator)